MRRPLTANGVPLLQIAQDTPATIFDLGASDVDADSVLLVTLFCYIELDAGNNTVTASVVTDGTSVKIGEWIDTAAVTENTFAQYRDKGIGAAKLLDRVPMRGDQSLVVEVTELEAGVFWYGYYERIGEAPIPVPIRPLQPGALSDPFNAPFVSITSPADGSTQTVTVHALDNKEEKLDFLTLYVYCEADVALGVSPTCRLLIPGSLFIPIPVLVGPPVADARGGQPVKIYEGIPVRAPDSTDNLFQIEVVGDDTAILTTVVYGSFARA